MGQDSDLDTDNVTPVETVDYQTWESSSNDSSEEAEQSQIFSDQLEQLDD